MLFGRDEAAVQEGSAPVQFGLRVQGTEKLQANPLPNPLVLPHLELPGQVDRLPYFGGRSLQRAPERKI
ncbi:MAG TPA: hypothetical protein VFA32_11215, partial [Dehalococcoidia bacterium]|nr:hypothetical protein [Dehalococcoidia bacterium]